MIYAIVGTNKEKREQAQVELARLGSATAHVYSEHVGALASYVEAQSMFGDKIIVHVVQVMEQAATRDMLIALLQDMKASNSVFIIDEPFADANRVKRLEKYAEKVFDARDVSAKAKEGDPFALCNAFARRDKKAVWVEWMKIHEKESLEAIHGALWWKMKTIWLDTRQGVPTKFTERECEIFGGRIIRASLDAHRGKADLKRELESILLGVQI